MYISNTFFIWESELFLKEGETKTKYSTGSS